MKITGYLKSKALIFFVMAVALIVNIMLMVFLEIAPVVILVTQILFFLGYAVGLMLDFIPKWKYYRGLEETFEALEEKTYLTEIIRRPNFYEGRLMHKILKAEEKYLNDIIAGQQREMMEYYDYVQMWVHEVKTPIAVSKLMIENHKNEITLSLEEEIDKIEGYVEQMLYYAKSGSLEADYKIEAAGLRQIVASVLKRQSKLIISREVWPKLKDLDYQVLTDDKWLEFILSQIVSNSVKYRADHRKGELVFDARKEEKHVILTIRDNGIGIGQADLDNAFRKGYIGENGRAFQKSTGMGLYICSQLSAKMGIQIGIDSKAGEWTQVTLILKSA